MVRLATATWLIGAMALTSCAPSLESQRLAGPPVIRPFAECGVPPPQGVVGVVRIWLPNRLELGALPFDRVRIRVGPYDDERGDDPPGIDADPEVNAPERGDRRQPFDVFLRRYLERLGGRGDVAVRIIVDPVSNYAFYDSDSGGDGAGAIHGVAVGDRSRSRSICGRYPLTTNSAGKSVARFRIDLGRIAADRFRSFVIALKPKNTGETVIFIDPKVRNDG